MTHRHLHRLVSDFLVDILVEIECVAYRPLCSD